MLRDRRRGRSGAPRGVVGEPGQGRRQGAREGGEGGGVPGGGEAPDRSTRLSAAIDSAASRDADAEPSGFAARLWREALHAGFAAARVKVVLGDGAKWIWNVASELFPDAVEMVDLWHAQEHPWEAGRRSRGRGRRRHA